jgi:glycosyltransferase involved in cell wall biosynthesis
MKAPRSSPELVTESLVSVVVPNYNHGAYLKQRLDSIFSQSHRPIEVILLDDASTDNSRDILKEYADRDEVTHLVINSTNSGSPFRQWKKGVELARGEWIWIAESDDWAESDLLKELQGFARHQTNIPDVVYAQSLDVNANGEVSSSRLEYTSEFEPNIWEQPFTMRGETFISNYLKVKNVIPNASGVIFRRKSLPKDIWSSPLMEMRMCGDWLFWIRLLKGSKLGFVPMELNCFRQHQTTTRNWSDKDKLFLRTMEERQVRQELLSLGVSDQEKEIRRMYYRWFRPLSMNAVLSNRFYSPRMRGTSLLEYLRLFRHVLSKREQDRF